MLYWDLEFHAMWLSVLGVDFVFTSGCLFIAKFALPYEQSLVGTLFTAMASPRSYTTSRTGFCCSSTIARVKILGTVNAIKIFSPQKFNYTFGWKLCVYVRVLCRSYICRGRLPVDQGGNLTMCCDRRCFTFYWPNAVLAVVCSMLILSRHANCFNLLSISYRCVVAFVNRLNIKRLRLLLGNISPRRGTRRGRRFFPDAMLVAKA